MTGYPEVVSPTEIRFERLLPGPIETVWAYLTDSRKRGEWFASGPMELRVGGKVSLRFKHSELSPLQAPPPERFRKMDEEGHSAEETITEFDPPRRLAFTWDGTSEVVFELAPRGDKVLLTLTHRKLPNDAERIGTAGGWHCHLTILGRLQEDRRGIRKRYSALGGYCDRSLLRLRDVHAALVVAQDQQVAAGIEFLVDAGTIGPGLRPQAVLQAVHAGVAGGAGKLAGERVLTPLVGAGHLRQAELPGGRARLHAMLGAGLLRAHLRRAGRRRCRMSRHGNRRTAQQGRDKRDSH
jgi:uncharacterized protein YndB with AHSA1/START domain